MHRGKENDELSNLPIKHTNNLFFQIYSDSGDCILYL